MLTIHLKRTFQLMITARAKSQLIPIIRKIYSVDFCSIHDKVEVC